MPVSPRRLKTALAATGLLAAGALVLTGCSTSSTASSPGANSTVAAAADINSCTPSKTTLTVDYGTQATQQMTVAVKALEKKYPGLTIEAATPTTSDYTQLTQQVVGNIAIGKRPDVIMSGLGQLRFWVDTYKPTPIDTSALDSTYKKQFLAAGTVNGKVYLAPSQVSAPVLLVNEKAYKAAGGTDASKITTLADLVKAGELVTKSTGKPSVSIPTDSLPDWFSQAFVQGAGASFVNKDGSAGFGSSTAIKALSIWNDLKSKNLEQGLTTLNGLSSFENGTTPFMVTTTSLIASIQKSVGSKFDWDAVDLPTLTGDDLGSNPAGGNGWIVLSQKACSAAYSSALVSELLSPAASAAASGTAYSYIPVDTAAAKQLLASSAATKQMTYAWTYSKSLSPWGGFAGKYTSQVDDQLKTMAEKLQTGSDTASTVKATVSSVDALVGKK